MEDYILLIFAVFCGFFGGLVAFGLIEVLRLHLKRSLAGGQGAASKKEYTEEYAEVLNEALALVPEYEKSKNPAVFLPLLTSHPKIAGQLIKEFRKFLK